MTLNDLVGIEYEMGAYSRGKCDCLGLVCLYYQELLGIDLGISGGERPILSARRGFFSKHRSKFSKAAGPCPDAVVLFYSRVTGDLEHVGVMVNDKHVLHSWERVGNSVIQPLSTIERYFKKVEFYTWQK